MFIVSRLCEQSVTKNCVSYKELLCKVVTAVLFRIVVQCEVEMSAFLEEN